MTSAVINLADLYGLRVVVDSSPNSIPPELLVTKREIVIAVGPMSKEQIESIPEFKGLIGFLKSHNLDEPVYKVFGGSPVDYLNLEETISDNDLALYDTSSIHNLEVVNRVKSRLYNVLMKVLTKNVGSCSTNTQAIIDDFRKAKAIKIPKMDLKARGFVLDYPNKLFREVDTVEDSYIDPSSPAISLIITLSQRIFKIVMVFVNCETSC